MGDFLFVPAGCWCRCESGPGRSLDVRIVLEPPCGRDVVTWLTSQLTADETFNAPLTRYADPSALASHEAALKARLIEQVQAWSLAGFLAERADRALEGGRHSYPGHSERGRRLPRFITATMRPSLSTTHRDESVDQSRKGQMG